MKKNADLVKKAVTKKQKKNKKIKKESVKTFGTLCQNLRFTTGP